MESIIASSVAYVDTIDHFKNTHREKVPSNKTPGLTKSMNMDIWIKDSLSKKNTAMLLLSFYHLLLNWTLINHSQISSDLIFRKLALVKKVS